MTHKTEGPFKLWRVAHQAAAATGGALRPARAVAFNRALYPGCVDGIFFIFWTSSRALSGVR